MALASEDELAISGAGTSADQAVRGRAVATVLAKQGEDRQLARRLLADSYLAATAPSFHLIPRGDAMVSRERFEEAYSALAEATDTFGAVSVESLSAALTEEPAALAPLRMIAGLTSKELAVAVELATGKKISQGILRSLERESSLPRPGSARADRRAEVLHAVAQGIAAVVAREILEVPPLAQETFHSKLDKHDTIDGWTSVERDARQGVPYSELLYQRYVGGVWRQVQDAYSEVKGDAILEVPLATLLHDARVPHWQSPSGATGARQTVERYGIEPGPDFLVPEENPAVIIETKVVEDGGSARDKAARIQRLGDIGSQRGLVVCAVVDGKGWSERPQALADVVIATQGRTFSLATLRYILDVPELKAWIGHET